ncbi:MULTISPECIES: SulP family inorganic anion transporter [unclassified Robiginitalea]|uniref:SulP family inorganic anion transporter n=1 Tax=Robiginitalea TaxID=252306 RepID=UPI00234951E1|nr:MULTISPECIES: solute carrier family 26 protein [unclassified Robiginitalea]MDC6353115.1 solute carrier family 26 protein [Robiginitalea sp. PM2]MDC6373718.1 solute carrier family 26 protein [Robiginitalea sp. SP8]
MKRFLPILDWLPGYKKAWLPGDLAAGLTVGILLIPQGMAYAMIAGLPPVFGLYAALVPQLVYALTGTSRQLAVGPVAMDSLLVASGLGALALTGIEEYIAMAVFLALFMGVLQLAFGLLRMGFLVNFLSRPVISGFTSAAAIIIGLSQLKHLLGVEIPGSNRIQQLVSHAAAALPDTHLPTLGLGLTGIALIVGMKKWVPRMPGSLAGVVAGTLAVFLLGWDQAGVKIVGAVPAGLPEFGLPELDMERVSQLFPIALTLALIAYMEAISVGKAVEEKHGKNRIDANQELRALGLSNILGSFFQSYPTTGGFSRTAVNDQNGAQTPLASVFSALVVGATLLFLTPLFHYLPNAILAAVIMVAVFGLIDLKYPRELWKNRKDEFILLLATFALTLGLGIVEGILLGVLFSLLLLVYRISKPHIAILGRIRGTDYFKNINRFSEDIEEFPEFLILRFDGQLFFGNKDYFRKELVKHTRQKGPDLKFVILNAEAISYIDSSAVYMLRALIRDLRRDGIRLLLAGAIGPTRDILFSSGLAEEIGRENQFVRTFEAFEHCRTATGKTEMERKVSTQSARPPV